MKYSMVKQFSNAAIDNAFNFFFRIVDFGKLMVEVFWAFLDIWIAFFMIFVNAFMYVYYFFLFLIDRGSESAPPAPLSGRTKFQKKSKIPTVSISSSPNPIPAMYRVTQKAAGSARTFTDTVENTAAKTVETAQKALPALKPSGGGSRINIGKVILEFIADFFKAVKDIIIKPFKLIADFLSGRLKPVKESEVKSSGSSQKTSLIDEYMKEYEKKRGRR